MTGDATVTAMRENFAALAMLSQPGRQPQIVRSGETSLEGLTRELLRPMLAQWLEDNLPGMVEEMVKAGRLHNASVLLATLPAGDATGCRGAGAPGIPRLNDQSLPCHCT